MSWEKKGNNFYYYGRKMGPNGKTVTAYLGNGPAAEQAAQLAKAIQDDKFDLNDRRARDKEIDRQVSDQAALIRNEIETYLAHIGFHKPKGTWRRKRK